MNWPAGAVVVLLLVLCVTPIVAAYDETEDGPLFRWGPYLTGTTVNTTVINWMCTTTGEGNVSYATDAAYCETGGYEETIKDDLNVTFHHLLLTGLEPDTCYHYQVSTGGEQSCDHTFRTFPENGPFTFIV